MKTVVGGGEIYIAWEIEENVRDGKKSRKSIDKNLSSSWC